MRTKIKSVSSHIIKSQVEYCFEFYNKQEHIDIKLKMLISTFKPTLMVSINNRKNHLLNGRVMEYLIISKLKVAKSQDMILC